MQPLRFRPIAITAGAVAVAWTSATVWLLQHPLSNTGFL